MRMPTTQEFVFFCLSLLLSPLRSGVERRERRRLEFYSLVERAVSVASRVDPLELCLLFNMISRSIVLVALVVVAAHATSVRKEAPVVADNDQFVLDFKGKKSPAQVMIDTLGKVVLDMRSDQKRDTELYQKIKSRCASELKSADVVMENDVKELKSASQKVKEDLH